MPILELMLVGIFPESMTKRCAGILPDGTACEERRLHLSRDGLCPSCQQRQDEKNFGESGSGKGWLSSLRRKKE